MQTNQDLFFGLIQDKIYFCICCIERTKKIKSYAHAGFNVHVITSTSFHSKVVVTRSKTSNNTVIGEK